MVYVYLALGSNLGNKKQNILTAIQKIEDRAGKIQALSSFFVTQAWGFTSDNNFLNAAACLKTTLTPHKLLFITQKIEQEIGRPPHNKNQWEDRLIDIDILLYDDLILSHANLIIPHPLMHHRKFVLQPLTEIAPDLLHPTLQKTMAELLLPLT
ncbi:MAG: 2-amino-4-hydroxy-6-hydroxymethyldihydropteridine diphosphokinase [Tannerellaceae bacterium]|jgi:2-amino-4-hydroxy-6-hydroxymethyldihydropteridine diphosphokinase|nr:2-amino-4-hydroxy-6-hydroxymethyldihydropteridine diphosphokinase [Tannerellaceae bacterium]